MTQLHMWMVTMASIVTVWMMWHIARSLPAHSITFCCGWCPLLSFVASDGGRWWVLAIGNTDKVLMLGALSLIVAMCWLGS